jgi:hypothetical protein
MREDVEQYAPMVLKELELEQDELENPVITVDRNDPRVWRIGRLEKISATNEVLPCYAIYSPAADM